MANEKPDFDVIDQGSIVLVTPMTPSAHHWIDKHIANDAMYFGLSLVVEHRYADDIIEGITEHGLSISKT
jgi:hypothetical protein